MAGYDCQFSSPMTVTSFAKELTAFLERPGEKWISSEMFSGLKKAVDFQQLAKMTPEERRENQQVIKKVGDLIVASKPVLQKAHSQREIAFWERVLKNFQVSYTLLENMSKGKDRKVSDNNPRDEAMAEILIWLANDIYPDRKIIVWAASFHNIRNIEKINLGDSRLDYAGVVTMGQRIYERLADDTYSIAFTAYQGESGNVNRKETYDIGKASEGSLEDLIHRTGKEFLFVDFTQPRLNPTHWLCHPITARPLGYTQMKTVWPEHFDAMIFTENMIPSTRIKNKDLKKEE
jgi:erythromycin esterase